MLLRFYAKVDDVEIRNMNIPIEEYENKVLNKRAADEYGKYILGMQPLLKENIPAFEESPHIKRTVYRNEVYVYTTSHMEHIIKMLDIIKMGVHPQAKVILEEIKEELLKK